MEFHTETGAAVEYYGMFFSVRKTPIFENYMSFCFFVHVTYIWMLKRAISVFYDKWNFINGIPDAFLVAQLDADICFVVYR